MERLWEQHRVLLASALTPDEFVATEYLLEEPSLPNSLNIAVPDAPYNFDVVLNEDEMPVISFIPRDTFAIYIIMRSVEGQRAAAVHQIQTGELDMVQWIDTQVVPGERYQYYIIPVHPEMKLGGEPVQGPQTRAISIEIPRQQTLPDNDFWDDIIDWFTPGTIQDDEEIPED